MHDGKPCHDPAITGSGRKEMKAFRNKDGITVTMLNPSLYSLYKQGDLSLPAEEALKDIKEINVMQVDIKRATPKVVEEISQRITPDRGKRGQIHARAQPPGSLQPRISLRDTTRGTYHVSRSMERRCRNTFYRGTQG